MTAKKYDHVGDYCEGLAIVKTNATMTKPTVVLGDVHGLSRWKEIVNENPDCRYIFLGDYIDPYEPVPRALLLDNLNEIIQLKKEQPDHVILLFGNHDLHSDIC